MMLSLYLACLVFGGILLFVSLFMGTDSDGDVSFDGDTSLDLDSDLDLDTDLDADTDLDIHGDLDAHGGGLVEALKFLSFRNIVLFAAFFGLTGTVLTVLRVPALFTAILAGGMGFFAATLGHKTYRYLKTSEVTTATNLDTLEGAQARVLVGMTRTRPGKILVPARDRTLQLLAMPAEEASVSEFQHGDSVIIVRIEDGVAYVAEEAFIHL